MRLGLRGEILGVFALVTLFAIGLNTLVVWQLDALVSRRERLAHARSSAAIAAAGMTVRSDPQAVASMLASDHDLEAAAVYDTRGARIAGAPPAGGHDPIAGIAEALAGRSSAALLSAAAGGRFHALAVAPIGGADRPAGALAVWSRVGADPGAATDARDFALLYVALDVAVAGALAWYLVSRQVLRPLGRLVEATRQVAGGDLSSRVRVASDDELGDIARDFNRMLETLAEKDAALSRRLKELEEANASLKSAREEVVQSEKLASVGRLAAGVAHELGNPVGAITGYVSSMLRGKPAPEDAEILRRVEREMARVDRIIRDLLDYARPRAEAPELVDPDELCDAALAIVRVQSTFKQVEVERRRGAAGAKIRADRHRLQQVLVNLLINAADAVESSPEKRIVVETERTSFWPPTIGHRRADDAQAPPPGDRGADAPPDQRPPGGGTPTQAGPIPALAIRVRDSGAGISPQHLPLLFDPFFTTKSPGRGTGLGLAIARSIVESAGGRIAAEGAPGKGATFTVLLPRID